MDAFSLYPPNTSALSDDVIGNVVQRVQPHRASNAIATEQPMDENLKTTLKILLEKRDRRREVCRINQARYVNRQRKLVADLEADIQKLQKEVKDLELQHHNVHTSSTRKTLWTVAVEYFSLFRCGITSTEVLHTLLLRFLQETMASDVTDGSLCGPEALLSNWRLFSLCFTDIHVELEEMKKSEVANTLVAVTTTRVTISNSTLRRLFPHLNSDGKGGTKGGKWSPRR